MKIGIITLIILLVPILIGSVIHYGQEYLKNRRKCSDRRNTVMSIDASLDRRRSDNNRRKQLAREVRY